MSNTLAVAAVTATLRRNLQLAFDHDIPGVAGAQVTHVRPNAPATQLPSVGANVFLYQVTPSVAGRNADAPTRSADGTVLKRPRTALDLHYLVSFYGDDAKLEPQRLLASCARLLHAQPVLERAAILDMIADGLFDFVADTDLADAPDLVRFSLASLTLEEMSKLWSVFFQSPYVLSIAYQAQLVFVDSPVAVRAGALPVREPIVVATPTRLPHVNRVLSRSAPVAPIVADQPILAGHTLVLAGRELAGAITRVHVGGREIVPASATDEQVEAVLPAGLRAGVLSATVVQRLPLGVPPVAHDAVTSNPIPFVLSPQITVAMAGGKLRVGFVPSIGPRQKVTVVLNERAPAPGSPPRVFHLEATTDVEAASLDLAVTGVAAASYLVRAQVDGAESPLHFDTATSRYDAPTVTIP